MQLSRAVCKIDQDFSFTEDTKHTLSIQILLVLLPSYYSFYLLFFYVFFFYEGSSLCYDPSLRFQLHLSRGTFRPHPPLWVWVATFLPDPDHRSYGRDTLRLMMMNVIMMKLTTGT